MSTRRRDLWNDDKVTHECRLAPSPLRTSGKFALRASARYFPSQSSDDFYVPPQALSMLT